MNEEGALTEYGLNEEGALTEYGLNEEGAFTEYGLNEEGALTEYNSVHKKEVGQAVQGMLMAYSIGFSRNSL